MATSTKQVVPLVEVYDYVLTTGDPAAATTAKPLAGKKVKVTLAYDRQRSSSPSPSTWLIETPTYPAVTDNNGFWHVFVAPTDQMAIANSYYIVEIEGYASYKINPTFAGVPGIGWQSSAILLDTPASLTPTGQTVGNLQVNGTLGVTGAVTFSALTTGQVVFPGAAGLLSGDANLFWDNTNKALGVGTNAPALGTRSVLTIAGDHASHIPTLALSDTNASAKVFGLNVGQDANGMFEIRDISAGAARLAIDTNGNVGIGTTAPGTLLDVNGVAQVRSTLNLIGVPGVIAMQGAGSATIIGGTTGFTFANNANNAANMSWTDSGVFTMRGGLTLNAPPLIVLGMTGASGVQFQNSGATVNWFILFSGNDLQFTSAQSAAILFQNGVKIAGDFGSGVGATLGLTNVVGIGNGANTNMQAPLKGTGGGPTTATLVTDWIKIYDGTTTKWLPAFT